MESKRLGSAVGLGLWARAENDEGRRTSDPASQLSKVGTLNDLKSRSTRHSDTRLAASESFPQKSERDVGEPKAKARILRFFKGRRAVF